MRLFHEPQFIVSDQLFWTPSIESVHQWTRSAPKAVELNSQLSSCCQKVVLLIDILILQIASLVLPTAVIVVWIVFPPE